MLRRRRHAQEATHDMYQYHLTGMEVNERSSPLKERERADRRQSSVVREGNMLHLVIFLNAATKGLKNLQVYAREQGSQIVTGL